MYIQSLARDIEDKGALHIYFKRLSVQMHNFEVLLSIPERLYSFHAKDQGNVAGLDSTIGKTIHLKVSCKVGTLTPLNHNAPFLMFLLVNGEAVELNG